MEINLAPNTLDVMLRSFGSPNVYLCYGLAAKREFNEAGFDEDMTMDYDYWCELSWTNYDAGLEVAFVEFANKPGQAIRKCLLSFVRHVQQYHEPAVKAAVHHDIYDSCISCQLPTTKVVGL